MNVAHIQGRVCVYCRFYWSIHHVQLSQFSVFQSVSAVDFNDVYSPHQRLRIIRFFMLLLLNYPSLSSNAQSIGISPVQSGTTDDHGPKCWSCVLTVDPSRLPDRTGWNRRAEAQVHSCRILGDFGFCLAWSAKRKRKRNQWLICFKSILLRYVSQKHSYNLLIWLTELNTRSILI